MRARLHFVYLLPPQAKWKSGWGVFDPVFRRPKSWRSPLLRWPNPVYAPYSITRYVAQALAARYDIRLYDWNEQVSIRAAPGDIIMVHPKVDEGALDDKGNPLAMDERSVAWRSLVDNPNTRKIAFMPYVPPCDDQWLCKVLPQTNGELLAICGETWTNGLEERPISRCINHFLRLDMGIDSRQYPLVKTSFNAAGKRKFLYVGHTALYKNTVMLEEIAARAPGFQGGHIGFGNIRGWKKIAQNMSFTPSTMRELAREYDLFLTVSSGDAQATTILEQSCFGLVIGCTRETGYDLPGSYQLHTSDLDENLRVISEMQTTSEDELLSRSQISREYVLRAHNWDQFTSEVINFIG